MTSAQTTPPKALHNIGFSSARMIVAAAGSLIVSVITARSLGARQMGTYSFVLWVSGTLAALSSLGLPDAVARYVAEHKSQGDHALAAEIARAILGAQILAAGVFTMVGAAVWSVPARHQLVLILPALATVMPSAVQQTLLALMEGEQRFHLQLIATLGGSILQIALVSIFAICHASLFGFLLANFLASAALTGFTLLLCRPLLKSRPAVARPAHSPEIARRIRAFSLSVYALWLLNLIVFDKSELVFLRAFQSPEELAYYSIAFALAMRLAAAGDGISYALFPIFVTRYTQDGADGLRETYARSIRYLQLFLVPVCIWLMPLAPHLVVFVYGRPYARVALVVQVLLATLLFTVTMTVSSGVVYTMDRQLSYIRFMVFVAALNIFLDWLLVPRYGAFGAALANGLSQAVAACGMIAILRNALPRGFPVVASLKTYFAAAVSAAPILYSELILHAGLLLSCLSILLSVVLYLGLLGGLRAVARDEFEALGDGFMSVVFRRAD